jgi:hypothetical protein
VALSNFPRAVAVGALSALLAFGPLPLALADGPGYGGDAGELSVVWEPAATSPTAPPTQDTSNTAVPTDAASTPSSQAPTTDGALTDTATAVPGGSTAVDPTANLTPAPVEEPASDAPAALSLGGAARGVGTVVRIPRSDPKLENDPLALVVRGLGFRGKSSVEVRVGSDAPVQARADTAGALSVALDANRLTGTQPGVSVMAVGRNQSGTEVTLFGSIPPKADGSGPMSLVPWVTASVALVGLVVWARRRHAHRPAAGSTL